MWPALNDIQWLAQKTAFPRHHGVMPFGGIVLVLNGTVPDVLLSAQCSRDEQKQAFYRRSR